MLDICAVLLNKLKPLIVQYQLLVQWNVVGLLKLNKSSCKLEYILLNVFSTLFQRGFCTPEEQEDTKFHDNVEGTGVGEGQGNKDVSDQVENEDQAMGHKEQEEPPRNENKEKLEEDQGVDMKDNDFEGSMENVDVGTFI